MIRKQSIVNIQENSESLSGPGLAGLTRSNVEADKMLCWLWSVGNCATITVSGLETTKLLTAHCMYSYSLSEQF